jgi:ATP-binding cassette subfamily B protein
MYLGLLIWPVMAIGWVFMIFQRGIASSKRILELMNAQPDVVDSVRTDRSIDGVQGSIKFNDVTFSYDAQQKPVLSGINLNVSAGSSLGIMGKPGSGKSTLIALLFRLFPIRHGEILIDGRDIHDFPLSTLRRTIGYVPQDPFLFSDTISNNIAFGLDHEEQGFSEIVRYARMTSIYEEIMDFGEAFKTVVGERGITLSGGQKQRVSIARALIIRPRILILDDALSSVDSATEREIIHNIREEMSARTTIWISHRVSTIKDCDNIIVLEDGRIREQGTHDELIKKDGYYSRLFELQKHEGRLTG